MKVHRYAGSGKCNDLAGVIFNGAGIFRIQQDNLIIAEVVTVKRMQQHMAIAAGDIQSRGVHCESACHFELLRRSHHSLKKNCKMFSNSVVSVVGLGLLAFDPLDVRIVFF